MKKKKIKPSIYLIFYLLFFIFVLSITPFIGSHSLNMGNVGKFLQGVETPDGIIFFQIRLPRIFLAMITGASLTLAGIAFQALMRNPLATPYTLGVSAGGALGAVFVIKSGLVLSVWGFSTIQTAAFLGSLFTILVVYIIARRSGQLSIHIMILAGVTISYFFGALILMIHFFADFTETRQMVRWMMGGLDVVEISLIVKSLPILIIAFLVLFLSARMLNIISTSEEMALSKGVPVSLVQKIVFITASLMTGLVVAVSGPIGPPLFDSGWNFIGWRLPCIVRYSSAHHPCTCGYPGGHHYCVVGRPFFLMAINETDWVIIRAFA